MVHRNLNVATSRQKTDSPPSTFPEDEDENDDKGSRNASRRCHQQPSPPWTRGDFRGVLVDRSLSVATSSQKTDSPSPTFVQDEHDDEDDSKGELQ